jgi:hypothetical protein
MINSDDNVGKPTIWGWFLAPISGEFGDGLLLGLAH